MAETRDHGGGIDAAIARWGGTRADWLDLSTGINPVPYPIPDFAASDWTALPDRAAEAALVAAARRFWNVPEGAMVLPAPGASALIAALPILAPGRSVHIPGPTYNEHAAAFQAHGIAIGDATADTHVTVHPNNPDGRLFAPEGDPALRIIDESFCDVMPEASEVARCARPGTVVLKSFGKFWGLAGLRLGFAIGHPDTLAPLAARMGPWAVSGPALRVGAIAISDHDWAGRTRARLVRDAARLDGLMAQVGAEVVGGTTLFRLYDVDAAAWHDRLGRARILSRVFPYSDRWLRLGLPHPDAFDRLAAALTDGPA
ncbi:L-threonine O-3-phosphate decarboxylase [Palleronia salina]|uniref:Aminotransferase n=1 Tax=Palleronia salina TaxID=313368 RepID=A0A1M6GA04_9RHOB|nr:threonine-phosphate decarboxylase [Palleronia salina]SHJ06714.1 L-threonine O-3-phosphate decarboxylase [Palleronia salina]